MESETPRLLVVALIGAILILIVVLYKAKSLGLKIDNDLLLAVFSLSMKLTNAIVVVNVLLISPETIGGWNYVSGVMLGFSLLILLESWGLIHKSLRDRANKMRESIDSQHPH